MTAVKTQGRAGLLWAGTKLGAEQWRWELIAPGRKIDAPHPLPTARTWGSRHGKLSHSTKVSKYLEYMRVIYPFLAVCPLDKWSG